MKLSVITPVYNEPGIRETLESILSQENYSDTEIIIVDGNSTDETAAIIDEYSNDVDQLIREPDKGTYDAMNKGIEHATGDLIGILNADDRYQHPNVLQSVIQAFSTSSADLCYGNLVYVNKHDEVIRYWKSGEYQPRRFYFGWMPPHPTVFIKKDIYENYELFDLNFSIAADYELLLRLLLRHKVSTEYLNDVLVRMSIGGKSNASIANIVRANLEVYKAWRKNRLSGGIHVPLIKPARKIPQFFRNSKMELQNEQNNN